MTLVEQPNGGGNRDDARAQDGDAIHLPHFIQPALGSDHQRELAQEILARRVVAKTHITRQQHKQTAGALTDRAEHGIARPGISQVAGQDLRQEQRLVRASDFTGGESKLPPHARSCARAAVITA